jgi:lipoprotein-releasing system permease protein
VPFNYFERFIAFRYLVPLRKGGLLSVISWLSFIGICIGVATLIIVMSVMNGFHDELKKRIIGFNGHIYIKNIEPYFENDKSLSDIKEILFIDRNISIQALISSANKSNGIVIKSINDENIKFYEFVDNLNNDNLLTANSIILGEELAFSLGVLPGDEIKVTSSSMISTPLGQIPRSHKMAVSATFSSGMSEYDKNFAFTSLANVQKLLSLNDEISTIEIHLKDINDVEKVKSDLLKIYNDDYLVKDWIDLNSSFWEVLATERELMFFVLSLIIIIAAFNIVTSLFILVQNKNREIAVLKTIGSSDSSILRIFLLVGTFIGFSGTIIGSILGILFTINIDTIRNLLNSTFNLNLFPSEFYYLDKMPTSIDLTQIILIILFSLIISIIATVYPAYKASKTEIRGILNNV